MTNTEKPHNHGNISNIDISREMRKSFLEYSMSVIVSRALPDVRDGMKPVHRRILFSMNEQGMYADRPFKKSARIVGDVIGKYHPHGDVAVYETMVRMAQDFSYRYMLVDGHGNFGSIDGDSPAAMRYTEARMSKISMELLRDLNKDTVDFMDNYDGEEKEPVVLPSRFPNLLVNGATGIAVGMATNIPPHNFGESVDAIIELTKNPDISVVELMDYLPGPDFPTGGYILGRSGIKQAYETGRGSIVCRGKTEIEEYESGKRAIIIKEIPYQVNKAVMFERIAGLAREKVVEGITNMRDESNREGIRIVIEIKKDVQEEVLLNQLYHTTSLQTTFGVNMLALVNYEPRTLNIKQMLQYYLEHQVDVVERATRFDLRKAEERAHILEGLRIALDHIDEIIRIIRESDDDAAAQNALMEHFGLSEVQSKAILDMQLRRLTGLQRNKLEEEYQEIEARIAEYKEILSDRQKVFDIIINDLTEMRKRFGDPRRTEIIEGALDLEDEDLIPVEEIFVTMTANGYIKRITTDTYRTQNRGGRGIKGMTVNEDDIIDQFIKTSTHNYILFFTNYGKVYRIKGYQIQSGSRTAKGIPVVNLLKLDKEEKVKAIIPQGTEAQYLFFVTRNGLVKRVKVTEFDSIRQNGKIAIGLREGDELVAVSATTGENEIIIGGSNGKAVRFNENDVRPTGRTASGVKGFNVDGSYVVGMANDRMGSYILSVTEKGYGKKSLLSEYRLTNRGTKGVKTINITEKNGALQTLKAVNGDEDLMIISTEGVVIRIDLESVSIQSRNTQGVKLINLDEGNLVATVAVVAKSENDEDVEGEDHPSDVESRQPKTNQEENVTEESEEASE
ncbi:MAG: DNA gyrase subunit A [Erysipelotrichaceae bacterium]|jgi:DNA gyrase subunit A|nr:DNA gyrase subunit A [Erysipelotrichaceae bacterium]